MIGSLPEDFLRVDPSVPTNQQTPQQQQINHDEQTARAIQYGGTGTGANTMGRLSITCMQVNITFHFKNWIKLSPQTIEVFENVFYIWQFLQFYDRLKYGWRESFLLLQFVSPN